MALTKYRLGDLIKLSDETNSENKHGLSSLKGMSVRKEFIETKADMNGVSLTPYLLVKPDYFSYVTVTSRNSEKITLAHNTTEDTYIVSSSYIVFYVDKKELLLSDYLFLYFNRPEFDRYTRFNSWGSARETFSWEDMCDMEIELPPIDIQQKYVDIYNAMLTNQKAYELGLDDLKIVCNGLVDSFNGCLLNNIGYYIKRNKKKNKEKKYTLKNVKGLNNNGQFIRPMRLFSGDISTFKIIQKNDFVYNSRINSNIERLSIALNNGEDLIVSPAYESFYIEKEHELYPPYLYMLLQREKFAKRVLFNSFGSSTIVFGIDDLAEIVIPVPKFEQQVAISNIYISYKNRWEINEKIKAQIKDICPILIKGSLEEARNN